MGEWNCHHWHWSAWDWIENAQTSTRFHLVVIVSEPVLKIVPFEILPPLLSPMKKFFLMLNGWPNMKISSDLVERIGFWNWLKFLDLIVLYWKFCFSPNPVLPCPPSRLCLSRRSFSLRSSSFSSSEAYLLRKFLILSKIPNGLDSSIFWELMVL